MTATVVQLTRSVMKGTRREAVDGVPIGPHGLDGDRTFALIEGKRALRTVANPALVAWRSWWRLTPRGSGVLGLDTGAGRVDQPWTPHARRTVTLWGRPLAVEVGDGAVARAASEALGRRVEVARVLDDRAIYADAVSVLFASELDALPPGLRDPRPLRMNVVIDDRDAPVHAHPGLALRLGEVTLRLERPMVRCRVIDIEAGRPLLAHVPRTDAGPILGWGATAKTPGIVKVGDRLR